MRCGGHSCSFGDGLIAEEVSDLREDWMQHADQVLADEQMVAAVYEALASAIPRAAAAAGWVPRPRWCCACWCSSISATGATACWSARCAANLVYRDFTRVGGGKVPDAKTMGRWGVALGPDVVKQIHDRIVEIARDKGWSTGRRMRVDTTVVETNIHHPTDSTLLGDGVRVLIRTMKKITADRRRGSEPSCATGAAA